MCTACRVVHREHASLLPLPNNKVIFADTVGTFNRVANEPFINCACDPVSYSIRTSVLPNVARKINDSVTMSLSSSRHDEVSVSCNPVAFTDGTRTLLIATSTALQLIRCTATTCGRFTTASTRGVGTNAGVVATKRVLLPRTTATSSASVGPSAATACTATTCATTS